jgi:hypothetical protein
VTFRLSLYRHCPSIFLNKIQILVFVIETLCVFSEFETEFWQILGKRIKIEGQKINWPILLTLLFSLAIVKMQVDGTGHRQIYIPREAQSFLRN